MNIVEKSTNLFQWFGGFGILIFFRFDDAMAGPAENQKIEIGLARDHAKLCDLLRVLFTRAPFALDSRGEKTDETQANPGPI